MPKFRTGHLTLFCQIGKRDDKYDFLMRNLIRWPIAPTGTLLQYLRVSTHTFERRKEYHVHKEGNDAAIAHAAMAGRK
jgi:hypothetical protein